MYEKLLEMTPLMAPLGTSHYYLSILADDFAHVRFALTVLFYYYYYSYYFTCL